MSRTEWARRPPSAAVLEVNHRTGRWLGLVRRDDPDPVDVEELYRVSEDASVPARVYLEWTPSVEVDD